MILQVKKEKKVQEKKGYCKRRKYKERGRKERKDGGEIYEGKDGERGRKKGEGEGGI